MIGCTSPIMTADDHNRSVWDDECLDYYLEADYTDT